MDEAKRQDADDEEQYTDELAEDGIGFAVPVWVGLGWVGGGGECESRKGGCV